MKILDCLMAGAVLCCIQTGSAQAQCVSGITSTLLSHDSTVTGVGSSPYVFTFPKFDATLGTLTSVRIQSVVTLLYTISIENTEAGSREVEHYLNRLDRISGSALVSTINNSFTSDPFGPYTLAANDLVTGSGPDLVQISSAPVLNNDTMINRTVYNTADFLGTGNVSFNYTTIPGSTTYGAVVNQLASSITDIIKFNITYVYCSANVLASNLINLSAKNAGPFSAMINWNTTNESQVKSYEVLVSEDGINFTTAAILPASGVSVNDIGNYQFKYDLTSPAKKLFFRIKQVTKDNRASVSAIKPVNWLTKANEIVFIPDPSGTSLSVQLPSSGATSWQVALLGINGQIIQTNYITASTSTSLPIKQKLSKGIYVVRARNSATNELITQKLFIQ